MATGINRERLRDLIAKRGKSWREVSLSAGLSETGVKDIINGRSKNPSVTTIAGLADVLQVGVEWLISEENGDAAAARGAAGGKISALPLRHEARPGVWIETAAEGDGPAKRLPAPVDPRWPRASQWYALVRGDSMNDVRRGDENVGIVDGDLAQIVDVEAIGYEPKPGDIVEIERTRSDGSCEISIKQVEVTSDGAILLWPRSTNRRWREPIELAADDETVTRISGRVLRVIRDL